jgi:uncharacterized protein (DUF58 family)
LCLLLALALVGAMVAPALVLLAIAADIAQVVAVLLAGRRLRNLPIHFAYEWPRRVQMDRPAELVYRIENRGRRRVLVRLRQAWPDEVEAAADTVETHAGPGEIVRVSLKITPRARGVIASATTELELRTGLDLVRVRRQSESPEILAYPNLKGIADYEQLRSHHAGALAGVHQRRLLGSGREFDQLRDYVPDDDYRDVNWKATARHGRPITSMFRAERSQEIMLCLDCGRMMGNPVGKETALDRAVDAAIMLAHVANRQGDRVGLALFRDVVRRFIKPAGGLVAVNRIIEALIDARPEGVFPSYSALIEALRARQKRRCMVFLFTDLNDPQLAANLAEMLPMVSRRHVVVVVSLRDSQLERIASGPAADAAEVYRVLAARELATERDGYALSLVRSGVQVLEADADGLTLDLINRYLKIKSRQLV